MSDKAKQKERISIIAGISVGVVGLIVVISLFASGAAMLAPKERLVKSNIGDSEIMAIKTDYAKGNLIIVPSSGNNGWLFYELAGMEDDVLASKLQIDSVICSNGTRRIIQLDNIYNPYVANSVATTFVFYYLGSWYLHPEGIPADEAAGLPAGMPNDVETLEAIWKIAS